MIKHILELVYPNVCGFCGRICKESLCKKCEIEINKYEFNTKTQKVRSKYKYYDCFINIFRYEGIIREKFLEYKFYDKAYMYKTFAKIMLKDKKICGFLKKYDIIIPIPIHKKRRAARGYNQTELLAEEIANKLGIRVENSILKKCKNTVPQSKLNQKQRHENVKDVFLVKNKDKIIGKNIILLDDIFTTGSTVNECSKILKFAGVGEIVVFTMAKD